MIHQILYRWSTTFLSLYTTIITKHKHSSILLLHMYKLYSFKLSKKYKASWYLFLKHSYKINIFTIYKITESYWELPFKTTATHKKYMIMKLLFIYIPRIIEKLHTRLKRQNSFSFLFWWTIYFIIIIWSDNIMFEAMMSTICHYHRIHNNYIHILIMHDV